MDDFGKLLLAAIVFMVILPLGLVGVSKLIEMPDKPAYKKAVTTVVGYCKAQCDDKWLRLIEVSRNNEFHCVCKKEAGDE